MDTLLPLTSEGSFMYLKFPEKALEEEKEWSLDNKHGTGFGRTGVDPLWIPPTP